MRAFLALLALLIAGGAHAQQAMFSAGAYPAGATPVVTSTDTASTVAVAVGLPASLTQRTWVCGFSMSLTATAGATGQATLSGTTGNLFFQVGTGVSPLTTITSQNFTPCLPSSAINTQIILTSAAPGAGGTVSIAMWGYQQ